MKLLFTLTISFFLTITVFSQTNFDEMKKQYEDYRKIKKHDSALAVAKRMNKWSFTIEKDTSLHYAISYRYIGNSFYSLKLIDSSLYYYQKSKDVLENQNRKEHLDYGKIQYNLGIVYEELEDFKVAEECFQKSFEIKKKIINEVDSEYKQNLLKLGVCNYYLGNYENAEIYWNKLLQIRKRLLEPISKDLSNLGVLYKEIGNFKLAEAHFQQALDQTIISKGEENSQYASIILNLGNLSLEIGDYKSSERYYKICLELRKSKYGIEHKEYAAILNNLAVLYNRKHDTKLAITYYKEALDIYKKNKSRFFESQILNNLGTLYSQNRNYNVSESYLKSALELKTLLFGEENLNLENTLCALGILNTNTGNYKEAETYFKKAIEIIKRGLGEQHSNYISAENNYANLCILMQREQEAYNILYKNLYNINENVNGNFQWLNDLQTKAYWEQKNSFYNNISWFADATYKTIPQSAGLNYNAALFTKSKLLEAKITSESFHRENVELSENLKYTQRMLTKIEAEGTLDKNKIDRLRKEVTELDNKLKISWPEYAQQQQNFSITWNQVQQNLENGEAAIEFVRFKNEKDSLYYYNALVIRKGDLYPQLIKLCKEVSLKNIEPKKGFSAYYPLVWKPFEKVLENIKVIYYSPIGELNNIPFHALYESKNYGDKILKNRTNKRGIITENEKVETEQAANFLINRYILHQLTSTRYLALGLKQKCQIPINKNIALVGGINYDYLPSKSIALKKSKITADNKRGEMFPKKLDYLPGTKSEIENINKILVQNEWNIEVLSGNKATEDNIIKLEGKKAPNILHIATHGYVFTEFKDTAQNKNSLKYNYRYSINPLVRSGLILAGGNWTWTGRNELNKDNLDIQDGILTALEVSQLNLKNTKLVVLSACETGLGKIEGGEGVFGLKRAFKLAGVEQIIVSLWEVPDKESMELMTLFYDDLAKTQNAIVSFEKAQKTMKNNYPTRPDLWAGFVLVR